MANAIYPKWKQNILTVGSAAQIGPGAVLRVALIDTSLYTYSSADEFESDIPVAAVVAQEVFAGATNTVINGLFDSDDIVFTAVSGASVEALIIFADLGPASNSPLIAYIDTGVTNLPFTPTGANVTIQWNASGIFQL